jgi:selenoprotein W-related protein
LRDTLVDAYPKDIAQFDLIPSQGGCFELRVDGQLLYSKLKTGQFPDENDLVDALGKMRAPVH